MPIFSWSKTRFLRRKTPERAVHVVLPPEPPPRHVTFDDWNNDGNGNGVMSMSASSGNSSTNGQRVGWRYADDVRVQIAPLARNEDLDVRERRALSTPRNPPPTITRSEYAPIAKTTSYDEEPRSVHLSEVNVVFLQRNDEVKRTMLPSDIRTMRQVQAAFCRAFNLNMQHLMQPYVRIYIQEPRGQLFYELEDPMDIRDKSVLRLKEGRAPSPSRLDYLSENDLTSSMTSSINRPASAMAAFSPPSPFGPPKPMFDPYDPYASDTASSHDSRSVTRSGSATPVIDRETKVRMDTMERQLAGLSSLVHSALKGMDDTSVRDMEILRRQVLAMQTSDRDRAPSEEPPSLPDSSISHHSDRTNAQLALLRERVQQTATEMRQLRRVAQVNAHNSREIIRNAGDQILTILAQRMGRRAESVIPTRAADARKEEHARELTDLLLDLTNFERNVEEVRASVLNSNRKLRMSEVEKLTTNLTEIGRNAANLKTVIPEIHGTKESDLMADVERTRNERNEAITAVDQSLRRCKALANIMVTMKKLAMVQDPGMQRTKSSSTPTGLPPSPSPAPSVLSTASTVVCTSMITPTTSSLTNSLPPQPPTHGNKMNSSIPPVPPSPPHYQSPISSLEGVLREVSSTPPPSPSLGVPPRPPSRFSVRDARQRMPTVMGTATVIPASPTPTAVVTANASQRDTESESRRARLDERQAALAEKQRQLHTQFEQLQHIGHN